MRVIAGITILMMYYKNAFWSAYMPINSNGAFNNQMKSYSISMTLNADYQVNVNKYKTYGPLLRDRKPFRNGWQLYLLHVLSRVYLYQILASSQEGLCRDGSQHNQAPVCLHGLRGWSLTNDATIQGGPGVVGKEPDFLPFDCRSLQTSDFRLKGED
jgi:hypothetical protein